MQVKFRIGLREGQNDFYEWWDSDSLRVHATASLHLTRTKACLNQALSVPFQYHAVEVASATIRYLSWAGPKGTPGVVLVHGMFAHAHWRDAVAPFLARDYNVFALDLRTRKRIIESGLPAKAAWFLGFCCGVRAINS